MKTEQKLIIDELRKVYYAVVYFYMCLKFFTKNKEVVELMLMAVIPACGRWKQDDQNFRHNLAHNMLRPALFLVSLI